MRLLRRQVDPLLEGRPFSAAEVGRRFREIAGEELATRVLDLGYLGEGRSVSLTPVPRTRERLGEFVFVVQGTRGRTLDLTRQPDDADASGVYWLEQQPERSTGPNYWTASAYRGNVRLNWIAATRATDERWETLTRVLTALEPAS